MMNFKRVTFILFITWGIPHYANAHDTGGLVMIAYGGFAISGILSSITYYLIDKYILGQSDSSPLTKFFLILTAVIYFPLYYALYCFILAHFNNW